MKGEFPYTNPHVGPAIIWQTWRVGRICIFPDLLPTMSAGETNIPFIHSLKLVNPSIPRANGDGVSLHLLN